MVGVVKLVVCGIGGVFCGFAGCDINIRNFKVRALATLWIIHCISMVMVMNGDGDGDKLYFYGD